MSQDKLSTRWDGMHSGQFELWTTLRGGYGRGPSMLSNCQLAVLVTCSVFAIGTAASAADNVVHSFTKARLSDQFFSEGATVGDFNQCGLCGKLSGGLPAVAIL